MTCSMVRARPCSSWTPWSKWAKAPSRKHPPTVDVIPAKLRHAPKIGTETCRIDWHQPVNQVYNLIRGLGPYPTAFTQMEGRVFKIFLAEMEEIPPMRLPEPGTYMTNGKTFLKFTALDGYIVVKDLQLEGKKRMGWNGSSGLPDPAFKSVGPGPR